VYKKLRALKRGTSESFAQFLRCELGEQPGISASDLLALTNQPGGLKKIGDEKRAAIEEVHDWGRQWPVKWKPRSASSGEPSPTPRLDVRTPTAATHFSTQPTNGLRTNRRSSTLSTTLYSELWNRFSSDYPSNCLAWRHREQPILPPSGDTWQAVWTANPDFLALEDRILLYYRGNGALSGREADHDRIGVSEVLSIGKDRLELLPLNGGEPIIDVGAAEEFDGTDVLDPATVAFCGKVFLYYSAIGPGEDSIGLAVSDDGLSFEKVGKIMTGRAPDVIEFNGKLRMIYQRADASGNYQVYLAESEDGYEFHELTPAPVLTPLPSSWDSLSIATVRLGVEHGWVYALYAGSSYLADEPDFFGLARSQDMFNWEFHPGNPIFGCGPKGAPDGGAIWFPALHQTVNEFVLLYEGSRGKYAWDVSSTICMATLSQFSP
jgi:predicted GH43/DUF377 family glycosyl hydrolase